MGWFGIHLVVGQALEATSGIVGGSKEIIDTITAIPAQILRDTAYCSMILLEASSSMRPRFEDAEHGVSTKYRTVTS